MGKTLLKVLDSMTIVNPHLEGETRTGTLPLTSEVLLSDIALTNISEICCLISWHCFFYCCYHPYKQAISIGLLVSRGFSRSLVYQNLCLANAGVSQLFI